MDAAGTGKGPKMKILVTGSEGFLGAALVRRLVADGHDVVAFDNVVQNKHKLDPHLKTLVGDVTNLSHVEEAFYFTEPGDEGGEQYVDAVFHLAAINGTKRFYDQPQKVLDVGIRGTQNVLDACRTFGVKELVFFSSSEVYNEAKVFPTPEDVPMMIPDVRNPRFSYAASKIAGEAMVLHEPLLDKAIVIRPHNVYGPDANPLHVIPQTIAQLMEQREKKTTVLDLQGDGGQTRSFVHVDDFINGVVLAWRKGQHRQIYNVGSDRNEISMRNLKEKVAMLLGHDLMRLDWRRTIAPVGEPRRRCPDVTRLRSLGPYEPRALGVGLKQTVDWYLWNTYNPSVFHITEAPSGGRR